MNYEVKSAKPQDTPTISKDGTKLLQRTVIVVGIVGNNYPGKFEQPESTVFEFPVTSTIADILTQIPIKAAAFVVAKYPNVA